MAGMALFEGVDQPAMVPVEDQDGNIHMVRFEPKGRGSQFQNPATGEFIETPEFYRQVPDSDLHTGSLDIRGDVEELRRVQELLEEHEKSQGTTTAVDELVELGRLLAKRFKRK